MLAHGISTGSVDNTHEWMSVDTPLRNLKAEMTMMPFHRVQQGKDHQDSETDGTLSGSFYLFSILTQAQFWPGKESLRITSVPQ